VPYREHADQVIVLGLAERLLHKFVHAGLDVLVRAAIGAVTDNERTLSSPHPAPAVELGQILQCFSERCFEKLFFEPVMSSKEKN
jgi:hypothetical protein